MEDSNAGKSFRIEYGFLYYTENELIREESLRIEADPSETCIVRLFLPAEGIEIPKLIINVTGT